MNGSKSFVVCLAASATLAFAASAGAADTQFQPESLHAFNVQLSHRQVHAAAFHPATGVGHIHVSLNDGRHMTVAYASAEQAKLTAQASAHGARVLIATAKAKAIPAHHRLRYIAGGILIVVILVILAVLLIGRRRVLAEQGSKPSEESASS